jgi:hypothetical protein
LEVTNVRVNNASDWLPAARGGSSWFRGDVFGGIWREACGPGLATDRYILGYSALHDTGATIIISYFISITFDNTSTIRKMLLQ